MPFIGNQPALSYTSFAKQDFTVTATTSYSLDHPVANANELALFINFVRQEPGSYSASGTQLTLTEATSSSDDMYAIFLGKAIQTVNPPNASVGTSQLADNGVTTAKIANDAVTKDKVSNLMYPAFEAYLSSDQNVADATNVKFNANTEVFDTDNCYDNSTNYRFTPTVAGKYLVYADLRISNSTGSQLYQAYTYIYKNGSNYASSEHDPQDTRSTTQNLPIQAVVDMNGSSDYVEIFGFINVGSGTPKFEAGTKSSRFGAYRIGD